jgi:hypothetical protein
MRSIQGESEGAREHCTDQDDSSHVIGTHERPYGDAEAVHQQSVGRLRPSVYLELLVWLEEADKIEVLAFGLCSV